MSIFTSCQRETGLRSTAESRDSLITTTTIEVIKESTDKYQASSTFVQHLINEQDYDTCLKNGSSMAISSYLSSGHTLLDEVTRKRNRARVQGRKLYGKIIGTTLLTKGLEADTIILVEPSELFKDKDGLKHLYVALTRAVKEIVLIDY